MTVYLDTSLLVAAFTFEAKTEVAQDLLTDSFGIVPVISEWVVTEFSAALSLKARTRDIDPVGRLKALASFRRLQSESLRTLTFRSRYFADAATYADRLELGLRGGDALHLAIAADAEAEIWTLDQGLARAARHLNFVVRHI